MSYEWIKLYGSFFHGSMRRTSAEAKVVFLAMVTHSRQGVFTAALDDLAHITNLSEARVKDALVELQQPDPESTSLDEEGRRILAVPNSRNTFRIVNFATYQSGLVKKSQIVSEVRDPDTGQEIPRFLPDGSPNPKWATRYKQLSRAEKRKREGRNTSSGVGGAVNSVSDVHSVNPVNSVHKERREEEEIEIDPPTPPKGRRRGRVPEALHHGKPENDETWRQFEAIYPKPADGMPLQKAGARRIWDQLAGDGQDMGIVVSGARAYSKRIHVLKMHHRVRQMTTWLNVRGWEESYVIDPSSEEGKRVVAEREIELRKRRAAHEAEFRSAHEAYALSLALDGIGDPAFQAEWRSGNEKDAQRKRAHDMIRAAEMIERQLSDPEESRQGMVRDWQEKNASLILDFWDWDAEMNPNGFESRQPEP